MAEILSLILIASGLVRIDRYEASRHMKAVIAQTVIPLSPHHIHRSPRSNSRLHSYKS